jgi:arsenical pump membrane protein
MDFVAREPFFTVCTITGATIVGLLFRPMRLPEPVWACLGALALILLHLSLMEPHAAGCVERHRRLLFLAGMMLLAELARWEGVFDWLAAWSVRAADKSASRLFLLIYRVGTVVTVFLSNNATAVVLTPAVRKAKVDALPYLLACARRRFLVTTEPVYSVQLSDTWYREAGRPQGRSGPDCHLEQTCSFRPERRDRSI